MAEGLTFEELVAVRAPALLRLALMLTGNVPDAEDLLQTALARAARHGSRITAMAAPAAYLRTVLVNQHVSTHRTVLRRIRPVALEGHDVAAPPTPAPPGARDDLWPVLATLPRQQRAVLVLRYYEDLTDSEIAEVLGCGQATVRSNASRALATLRVRLSTTEEVSR